MIRWEVIVHCILSVDSNTQVIGWHPPARHIVNLVPICDSGYYF
jgi:hypothetical protein